MTTKKLSVILPNYNYAHYFEHRLDSILSQNYPIYELIILDDASTDDSNVVINTTLEKKAAELKDIKIKTIFNKQNSGNVFKQWQKGIENSTGDYIWMCELDDDCKKTFLRSVMPAFDDEKVILSFANSIIKNNSISGRIKDNVRQLVLNPIREDRPISSYTRSGEEEIAKNLYIYNTIPNVSATVFRKSKSIDFEKILHEASKYKLSGDWYFYVMLLLHGDVHYCCKPLNIHRVHSSSVTNSTSSKDRLMEMRKIHQLIESEISISESAKSKARKVEQKFAD